MLIMIWWLFYVIFASWLFKYITARRSNSLRCMAGKTAIVTGGNCGIGFAISTLLASRGCRVIIADKDNAEKSCEEIKKKTGNPNVSWKHLDLISPKKVREFCDDIISSEPKIDVLINNAGVGGCVEPLTRDGLNATMQINYYGSFLLTHLLLGALKAADSARVIFNGSVTVFLHDLTSENLNVTKPNTFLNCIRKYGSSKLCNLLAAQEFGRRLKKYGITANSADPGGVRTRIFDLEWASSLSVMCSLLTRGLRVFTNGIFFGAQTAFHLATSEELEGVTGEHFFLCRKWIKPKVLKNDVFVQKIWEQTEILVGLKPEEKLSRDI